MSEIKPPTPNDTTRQASPISQPPKPTRPAKRKRKAARPAPPLTPPWLEGGIDYSRVLTDENYEQVLARFLVGRAAGRGLR